MIPFGLLGYGTSLFRCHPYPPRHKWPKGAAQAGDSSPSPSPPFGWWGGGGLELLASDRGPGWWVGVPACLPVVIGIVYCITTE
jgi:hypothetical protein